MSFEIPLKSGGARLLRAAGPSSAGMDCNRRELFVDSDGCRYSAAFDGKNVIFNNGTAEFKGRWLQGTSATIIESSRYLAEGFTFNFVDHGPTPQRLHAVWTFQGSVEEAVAGWKQANFSVSNVDRRVNRNHPASLHLRTRGAMGTGTDSSHVTIPLLQAERCISGEIHIGEFNPLTGFGLGFLLHHLERWM